MIATLLLLLAVLDGSPAYAPASPWAYRAAPLCAVPASMAPATSALPSWSASPAIAPSQVITYHALLPLVARQPSGCEPIPGVQYGTLDVDGPPTDPPAE